MVVIDGCLELAGFIFIKSGFTFINLIKDSRLIGGDSKRFF